MKRKSSSPQTQKILENTNLGLLLEDVADSFPGMILIIDIKKDSILYANEAVEEFLGLPKSKLISNSVDVLLSHIHPNDITLVKKKVELAVQRLSKTNIEKKLVTSLEYRMRYSDDSWHWVHTVIWAMRQNNKYSLNKIFTVSTDITERKAAEKRSQELAASWKDTLPSDDQSFPGSAEQFKLLVEGVDDYAIYLLDPTGHILTWNQGAQLIKGYTSEEILGQNFSRFFPTIDRTKGRPQKILKLARQYGTYEEEALRVRKDGTHFWAHILLTAIYDEQGKFFGYSKVTRDVTMQRYRLLELENIKYAIDQSAIISITDENGIIIYANKKFEEISQYSKEELIGNTHHMLSSGDHPREFYVEMWNKLKQGIIWKGEIKNRKKDGTYYWVDMTITPLLDDNNHPKQFISIRYDITKRKELERQKDEFIGIASHELKTPVTSLKGYIQVMHKRFLKNNDPTSATYMSKMDSQISKLTTLIQDLLDVTKIATGKLQFYYEYFDLNSLVRETVEALQLTSEFHKIEHSGYIKQDVWGDRERIGQVITNFLSNAIKYSPDNTMIKVSTRETDREIIVSVKDQGVGIDRSQQEHLFERFYRVTGAKENTFPGLGLGLYISAEIIMRHKGRIWVKSTLGKGSTFSFSLLKQRKRLQST